VHKLLAIMLLIVTAHGTTVLAGGMTGGGRMLGGGMTGGGMGGMTGGGMGGMTGGGMGGMTGGGMGGMTGGGSPGNSVQPSYYNYQCATQAGVCSFVAPASLRSSSLRAGARCSCSDGRSQGQIK
jgi:hypothetical protein